MAIGIMFISFFLFFSFKVCTYFFANKVITSIFFGLRFFSPEYLILMYTHGSPDATQIFKGIDNQQGQKKSLSKKRKKEKKTKTENNKNKPRNQ